MMRCKSKLAAMALSATLMIHVGVASAADDMKKDTMGKDTTKSGMTKKDAMASDCPDATAGMPRDAMKQDSMAHGAMAGDAMKKSAKDCADAAAMKKGGQVVMKGASAKQDAMGKDAMKK
jgi:pentapeptide MXKDX repeat protein